jgi:son of sevenless-like protein
MMPHPPSDAKPTPEKLYLLPAKDVAEGLTTMDADLLKRISPDELHDGAWMKRAEKEKLAPNVLAMVQSFNQLALLVPTEILSEETHQQRAKVISAYIQIASKCYCLKNYNSLKAILAGLQSTPVHRLKRTWKDISSKRKK